MLFLNWHKCVAETHPYSNGWVSTGNVCEFTMREVRSMGEKYFHKKEHILGRGLCPRYPR